MVEWSQSLQISMIGGAFIFAYVASTIRFNEKFDNAIRLFFYLFAIGMVVASTGMNYPILEYEDSALLSNTSVGSPLGGVFTAQVIILSMLFLLLLIFTAVGIVMTVKEKNRRKQYGEPDKEE